ncbi:MAG: hypothetical protein AAF217_00460 [Pseudomonadota bacterium]
MLAERKSDETQELVRSEGEILKEILSGPANAVEIGEALPEMQRARIAQFCYNRVHMRELGLRLASTCEMYSLKVAFGRAADVVFEQSRDIEKTMGSLKNMPGSQPPKPVTLKSVTSS